MRTTHRFGSNIHICFRIITVALMATVALGASSTYAQSSATCSVEVQGLEEARVTVQFDIAIFKIPLPSEHPAGLPVTHSNLISTVEDGGVNALYELLSSHADVTVLARSSMQQVVDEVVTLDMGGEFPFSIVNRDEHGVTRRSQQAVRAGILIESCLSERAEDWFEFRYRVEISEVFTISNDDQELIGRNTSQMEHTTSMNLPTDVHLRRHVQIIDEEPVEYVLVFHLVD